MIDDDQMVSDGARTVHLSSIDDVAAQFSGHLDRFDKDDAWDRACFRVWRAAEYRNNGGFVIERDVGDAIFDAVVNEEL